MSSRAFFYDDGRRVEDDGRCAEDDGHRAEDDGRRPLLIVCGSRFLD